MKCYYQIKYLSTKMKYVPFTWSLLQLQSEVPRSSLQGDVGSLPLCWPKSATHGSSSFGASCPVTEVIRQWTEDILFQMPAVAAGRVEDEARTQPSLFNIANRGLCLMGKTGTLQAAGDCSIVLLGSARSSQHNLKGYVFGLKFYPSRCKEVHFDIIDYDYMY